MKKKKLNHNGLRLNKNTVSSLESESVKGGTNASIFFDVEGNCYVSVTTCPNETIQPSCVQTCETCGCQTQFQSCGNCFECETNGLWSC